MWSSMPSTVVWLSWVVACAIAIESDYFCEHGNSTLSPANLQLCEYKIKHPIPAILTTTSGRPVEIRETITINSQTFSKELLLDTMMHFDEERVPERLVHAKGTAALGYFEVTHDVSHYTKADVFNGIGKKTPLVVRLSTSTQSLGGPDVTGELKGFAVKFYTHEGNLDFTCLQTPVYLYQDPLMFSSFVSSFKRNHGTNLFDLNSIWNVLLNEPTGIHTFLWTQSDYGLPKTYRHMDAFPIHTYEINNKQGDTFYVKFNFRTEQGVESLTGEQLTIARRDIDFYTRDLYNSIANKTYPAWRLEMDVMTFDDLKHIDYDPFDVSRMWKNGTYHTVQIGRLVLNKNPDNFFKIGELSAFNPANLVPGIPGPVDVLFQGRRVFYRDTQNYRVGVNHNKVEVNRPLYAQTYTKDGRPPVLDNMRDAPVSIHNSFNGPRAVVDASYPEHRLRVFHSNAVDLAPHANFYNYVLVDDAQRQRLADSLATGLAQTVELVKRKALKLLNLISPDLGRRVSESIKALQQ